jgi:hypothetical protein
MSEDIVEFGATAPRPERAPRRNLPKWLNNGVLPVAAVGALAGAGSLMLPWQKIVFRPEEGSFQTAANDEGYQAMLISLGAYGSAYLLTLVATVTAVALLFYGQHLVSGIVRVIAGALSAANLVVIATTAFALNKGTAVNVGFVIFGPADRERMAVSLDWGFYAALTAVVALGVAAMRAQPLTNADDVEPGSGGEAATQSGLVEGEPDDGVIDLSVSVHPVGKQVAAG